MYFEWSNGRNLCKINNNGDEVLYTYNSEGIRISKNVNGNTVEYYLDGNNVVYEKGQDYAVYYMYDMNGELIGFEYEGNIYVYKKNGKSDIIGIMDVNGDEIVHYEYDAWGETVNIYGNDELAKVNSFRYKSYYFDDESGLYYLNSRYYDPETGRFINADKHIDTGVGTHSSNMFAYCENAPVARVNYSGESWVLIGGVLVFVATTLTACTSYSSYTPKYSTKYSWDKVSMELYNCYGYALKNTKSSVSSDGFYRLYKNPGEVDDNDKTVYYLDLNNIAKCAISDLKYLGYDKVMEIGKNDINKVAGTVICVRIGAVDYHWMRYTGACWLHKPGNSAILKLKSNPEDHVWNNELLYNDIWEAPTTTYTGDIRYIVYK